MRPVPATQASRHRSEQASQPSLLARLKDPQVWVCAIAAFTLLGLSTGLLGGEPADTGAAASSAMRVASASTSLPPLRPVRP